MFEIGEDDFLRIARAMDAPLRGGVRQSNGYDRKRNRRDAVRQVGGNRRAPQLDS